jgi:hypothetical protein
MGEGIVNWIIGKPGKFRLDESHWILKFGKQTLLHKEPGNINNP